MTGRSILTPATVVKGIGVLGALALVDLSLRAPGAHVATLVAGLALAAGFVLRGSTVADRVRQAERSAGELAEQLSVLTHRFGRLAREAEQYELASRAKTNFLTAMSHELRTPLNAILGYSLLLEEDAAERADKAMGEDLGRIRKAGQHMLQLVEDLLNLASVDDGRTHPDRALIDTRKLVEDLRFAGDEALVEIEVDRAAGLFIGNRDAVARCLGGIVTVIGARWRGLKLTARLDSGRPERPMIAFRIEASGLVVAIDGEQPSLFGGLATSQRLAKMLGGELVSELEKDSIRAATLRVPLRAALAEDRLVGDQYGETAAEAARTAEIPAAVAASPDRGKVAVVIDDHRASVDLMERWLSRDDYRVLAAADGRDGLELVRRERPDLVVLDIHLPGMSGYDVLDELARDPRTAAIPVVVVTVDDDRDASLSRGAAEYIRKPVSRESLAEIMRLYGDKGSGDVLIIDDDAGYAGLVRRYAEQVGLTVRHAPNGEAGLESIYASRPSVVVLDLRMPRVDGFEVMRKLRSDPALEDLPVIVMSAADIEGEDYREISESGFRYAAKGTLSPREIAARLKEYAA